MRCHVLFFERGTVLLSHRNMFGEQIREPVMSQRAAACVWEQGVGGMALTFS